MIQARKKPQVGKSLQMGLKQRIQAIVLVVLIGALAFITIGKPLAVAAITGQGIMEILAKVEGCVVTTTGEIYTITDYNGTKKEYSQYTVSYNGKIKDDFIMKDQMIFIDGEGNLVTGTDTLQKLLLTEAIADFRKGTKYDKLHSDLEKLWERYIKQMSKEPKTGVLCTYAKKFLELDPMSFTDTLSFFLGFINDKLMENV